MGGLRPERGGGGWGGWVTGPEASGSAFSYVCNFLSPLPSLLLPKAPAKKASPSPQPQQEGGPTGEGG